MRVFLRGRLWGTAALAFCVCALSAQVAELKLPVFDVVSVRPNDTGSRSTSIDVEKNSFTATNVTLIGLTSEAYQVKPDLIAGGAGVDELGAL